ncbi:MAG: hypothetical protein L6V81_09875 [Clostridium sp.]|nr:MAG: hypothetical protein L6V81_09875 [Clostridium sp.]
MKIFLQLRIYKKRFSDIYKLDTKREELIELEGFGNKSVDSILESIEKNLNLMN